MNRVHAKTFQWKGKSFDVFVTRESARTTVQVLSNGQPVLPFTYSVDFETATNFKAMSGEDAVTGSENGLVQLAEGDVKRLL